MNSTEIIWTFIGSSFTAAVLTALATHLFNRYNYTRDYYKKIIDKRMDAYSDVESIMADIRINVMVGVNTPCPEICTLGGANFTVFIKKVSDVSKKSIWLSNEMARNVVELNSFLVKEVYLPIAKSDAKDDREAVSKALKEFGVKHSTKIKQLSDDMITILRRDMKTLHHIKDFLTSIRVSESFPLK